MSERNVRREPNASLAGDRAAEDERVARQIFGGTGMNAHDELERMYAQYQAHSLQTQITPSLLGYSLNDLVLQNICLQNIFGKRDIFCKDATHNKAYMDWFKSRGNRRGEPMPKRKG